MRSPAEEYVALAEEYAAPALEYAAPAQENAAAPRVIKIRIRTKNKGDPTTAYGNTKYPYATSGATYIGGHVVSDTSRRFIVN